MPTYEYHCDHCDRNFDVVQSFQDDPLTSCPTCGSPVKKVFGNVGIVFKGSGFYKTDSRNGSSKAASSTAGKDGKDGASDSSSTAGSGSSASSSTGSDAPPSSGGSSTPSPSPTPAATTPAATTPSSP